MTLHLPLELISQILLRLPVKSLICFKSVCKTWFTLISDPDFANSHFQFSESTQTLRKILTISPIPPQIRSIDFEALFNNHSNSINPNLSLPQSYFPLEIKASCRGFLFLHNFSSNYIWNPSTGFHKKIPLSPFCSNLGFGRYRYYLGFGYDHSRDDYLVVSLSYDPAFITVFLPCLEIFSLRDNAWKEIEDTPFPYWSTNSYPILGLFFNGAIHWRFSRGSSVDVIVGFSLLERKLFEIPLPSDFGRCFLDIGSWVFGEFLSLWTTRDRIVEIWVMKEYKVHSSWTKTLVIPIPGEIYDKIPCFYPMCCENSGDIIGTDGRSALVKYNIKGQLLGHYSFCNHPRGSEVVMYTESLLSVVMYTESLLSLPGNHEQV